MVESAQHLVTGICISAHRVISDGGSRAQVILPAVFAPPAHHEWLHMRHVNCQVRPSSPLSRLRCFFSFLGSHSFSTFTSIASQHPQTAFLRPNNMPHTPSPSPRKKVKKNDLPQAASSVLAPDLKIDVEDDTAKQRVVTITHTTPSDKSTTTVKASSADALTIDCGDLR